MFGQRRAARRSGGSPRFAWLRQHRSSVLETVAWLRANPGTLALSVLVIGVTLSLPLSLRVLQENVVAATRDLGHARHVTLYMTMDSTLDDAHALATTLRADERVLAVQVIDRDEALAELRRSTDLGTAIATLTDNPLPHSLALQVTPSAFTGVDGNVFETALRQTPRVADATFDITWIRRLEAISRLLQRTALAFATIIAAAVVLIIGQLIRAGIHNRRDEIEVAKLCGATDAYVCRPFLYNGAVQGLLGALAACVIVAIAVWWVREPAQALADAYGSGLHIVDLSFRLVATALTGGALLGWLGALIAANLYIRKVDLRHRN